MTLNRYRSVLRTPSGPVHAVLIRPLELLLLPMVADIPFTATLWSLAALAARLYAAWWIATSREWLFVPILLAASVLCDALNGDVARWQKKRSPGLAWMDAVLDQAGNLMIMAATLHRTARELAMTQFVIFSAIVLTTELIYQTLRVWLGLTATMLRGHVRLPRRDYWFQERGLLLRYTQDVFYLLISVLPLYVSFTLTLLINVAVTLVSYSYVAAVYWEGTWRASNGRICRESLVRKTMVRVVFLMVFLALGEMLKKMFGLVANFELYFAWTEFLFYFLCAHALISRQVRTPHDPERAREYNSILVIRVRQFLERVWP